MTIANIIDKHGKQIDVNSIEKVINSLIIKVIENNIPYRLLNTVEAFPHPYKLGAISHDYSGTVEKMDEISFRNLLNDLEKMFWYGSELNALLSSVYIDQWYPTFESNCGKHWVEYLDIIKEEYQIWKQNNFRLYDEENDIFNEELEEALEDILYGFIENQSHEFYSQKILKTIKR